MKSAARAYEATGLRVEALDVVGHDSRARVAPRQSAAVEQIVSQHPGRQRPSAIRIVGILAFCQSIIFLVIWLFICATAGAATKPTTEFAPELKRSSYDPVTARDPFTKPGFTGQSVKAGTVSPSAFQLQGILYEPDNPSAIVNDKLVTLNKIVTLNAGNAEVQVKVVGITRTNVTVEVGGQRIELQLSSPGSQQSSGER